MPSRPHLVARRAQLRGRSPVRKGATVTWRRVTMVSGPDPLPNPPAHGALTVLGDQAQGNPSIVLAAASFVGRVVAGDGFLVRENKIFAATTVVPASPASFTVPLAYGLPIALVDGEPVAPLWSGDTVIQVDDLGAYDLRLVDGEMIQRADLRMTVNALDLPFAPKPQDKVFLPDGTVRTVVACPPELVDGVAVRYRVQAR